MDAFTWLYTDIVKDHFMNPRNVFDPGENIAWDADGIVGNVKCGDQMQFFLKVDGNDMITDVRWKTYGCASAIASTSMLSEIVKGLSILEAYQLKPEDVSKRLGGLPDNKIHCSVLGDKALRSAIDSYLAKTGRAGAFKDVGATVVCTCLNITDRDIEQAVKEGARTWEGLQERTKIGTVCGGCKGRAEDLLVEYVHVFGHDE